MNVETVVIGWLNSWAKAEGYPASGSKPDPIPEQYILVDRTGGPRESMVLDAAEIRIQVYDKNSRLEASDMANRIADRIPELLAEHNITRAKVNSVVNLDDVIGGYNRYHVYADVFNRR